MFEAIQADDHIIDRKNHSTLNQLRFNYQKKSILPSHKDFQFLIQIESYNLFKLHEFVNFLFNLYNFI